MPRYDALPVNLPPRGLAREAAAQYVGISPSKFDELIADGRMPKAIQIDGRKVWDRHALDRAFDALTEAVSGLNPWDRVLSEIPLNKSQRGRKPKTISAPDLDIANQKYITDSKKMLKATSILLEDTST